MPTDAVLRELVVRQLDAWLPVARQRARRATLALAYAETDADGTDAALRVVADHGDRLRGFRLTVVVLAPDAKDLPARLGAVEATLPAEVAVHVLPGDATRLPVALKAAGATGAPLLAVVGAAGSAEVAAAEPPSALLTAVRAGRPADLLLLAEPGPPLRPKLSAAGFPLVAEADLLVDGGPARRLAFATGSDRSLAAFKDALWAAGAVAETADAAACVRYRDPADPHGPAVASSAEPDPEPLARELLAELRRTGPRTLTELRRHALVATCYRATDATRAVTALLAAEAVTRDPEHGRLGGDVVLTAAEPTT